MNLEYNELIKLVESYKRITKIVIIVFDDPNSDTKNIILRNFISKSHSLLNSINILLKEDQEGEAMALYRLIIERYLYLEHLNKKNSYQAFKDWSFIKTFESRNKTRSSSEFNSTKTREYLIDQKEQVEKYEKLKKEKKEWEEPKIENLAKELNLSFLYSLGYDLGSSYIHPRADEGFWDALRIVKNEKIVEFKRNNILKNSILMANSILSAAVKHSDIKFDKHLNYYCKSIFEYLNKNEKSPNLKSIENLFCMSTIIEMEKKLPPTRGCKT